MELNKETELQSQVGMNSKANIPSKTEKESKSKLKSKDGFVIGLILSTVLFFGSVALFTFSAMGILPLFNFIGLKIGSSFMMSFSTVCTFGSLFMIALFAIKIGDNADKGAQDNPETNEIDFDFEEEEGGNDDTYDYIVVQTPNSHLQMRDQSTYELQGTCGPRDEFVYQIQITPVQK